MKKLYEYRLKKIERTRFAELVNHLSSNPNTDLFIFGKSGVGKTTLVNDVIQKMIDNSNNLEVIYFDVLYDLGNAKDKFLETMIIKCLLNPSVFSDYSTSQISQRCTFSTFLSESSMDETAKRAIKSIIEFAYSFLPIKGDISKLLSSDVPVEQNLLEHFKFQELVKDYFEQVFTERRLILVIDNIQLLHYKDISLLRYILENIDSSKITIYREKDDEYLNERIMAEHTINPLTCNVVQVDALTISEVDLLLSLNLENYDSLTDKKRKQFLNDFYNEINGNAFELSNGIRKLNLDDNKIITHYGVSNTIYNLDLISKQILYMASLLKNGIRNKLVQKTLLAYTGNISAFENCVTQLLSRGYLDFNEYESGLTRLSHEKIIDSFKDFPADEKENIQEIVPHLIDVMLQEAYYDSSSIAYLVSTIIPMIELNHLGRDLYVVYKYIQLLYSNYSYNQISELYKEKIELKNHNTVVEFFPVSVINMILDSLVKTGHFDEGIILVDILKEIGNFEIYRAKYYLQNYNYKKAFSILNKLDESIESRAIYINGLQHLRLDQKAIDIISTINNTGTRDIYYHLILRNSGHLVSADQAAINLMQCIDFFPKESFYQATCYNNLGIIELYRKSYINAKRNFLIAKNYFEKIKSSEVYQAYFNLSTYYLLTGGYENCIDNIKLGFKVIPQKLKYDILKFKNNLLIAEFYLQKDKDYYMLLKQLHELLESILLANIDDPNLRYVVAKNIYILEPENKEILENHINSYPGIHEIYNVKMDDKMGFYLSISPHWRF